MPERPKKRCQRSGQKQRNTPKTQRKEPKTSPQKDYPPTERPNPREPPSKPLRQANFTLKHENNTQSTQQINTKRLFSSNVMEYLPSSGMLTHALPSYALYRAVLAWFFFIPMLRIAPQPMLIRLFALFFAEGDTMQVCNRLTTHSSLPVAGFFFRCALLRKLR